MKINVANIPEEGLTVQFSKDENWSAGIFTGREAGGASLSQVEMSGLLKRIGQTLYLEGTIQALVETDCSRCLEVARLPVNAAFKYIITPAQNETTDEKELNAEDLDFVFYQDDLIDLDPLVAEQIMLQIPMKVVCREDCKGLCPHCGINLNTGACHCHEERIDSRLAVLKRLKV